MTRPSLTRKDLVYISLALFFSIILVFTGLCIDSAHVVGAKKNPIQGIADALHFDSITPGTTGFIMLVLIAVYLPLLVAALLYEKRLALNTGKNPLSGKMFLVYGLTALACILLSVGVGLLIQTPKTAQNLGIVFKFTGQSLLLALLIYAILLAVVGGIAMFIINFLLVDKPFKFFGKEEVIIDDEEEEVDVAQSFDQQAEENTVATDSGAGAPGMTGAAMASVGEGGAVAASQAATLDDREKVFPELSKMDIEYDGFAIDKIESAQLTLEKLCVDFRNYLAKQEKLYFDIDTIRFFISGFATSHFSILEGLSGTGKSSLPRYFGKFVNGYVRFLPVQATWRDKSNILGYFNSFSNTYSETDFLTGLYHANYNPDMIHIFVLDEMNISRVEYYFADFLSVLEYPKEEWQMRLMHLPHSFVPPAKIFDGCIHIPENSYFVGTANKDDSAFTIAEKVYDRAITIDFDKRNPPFEVGEQAETIQLSASALQKLYDDALQNTSLFLTQEDYDKLDRVTQYIYEEFEVTFGNRILNQIEKLIPVFVTCGGQKEDALDLLISRKVISKLEGRFEDFVKGALKKLSALIEETYGKGSMPRCQAIIANLIKRL